MKRIIVIGLMGLAAVGLILSNWGGPAQPEMPAKKDVSSVAVPNFNRDSAFAYVAKQVAFGPRKPNTKGHTECKNWLVATFKGFGAEVIEQNFEAKAYTGEVLKGTNIIAQYNTAAQRRVLLSAHWDTRHIADHDPDPANHKTPILGADDGGSGVGVLLEVARQLQTKNPDLGVDIILWDAEDYGNDNGNDEFSWCLGSQYWSRNPHKPGYRAMYGINLDMVGASNARFGREGVSMQFASSAVELVWETANSLGYGGYFVSDMVPGITDDHRFVNEIARIPMIDVINRPADANGGFVKHWHTVKDDMSAIDANTLMAVGQTMLAVIYREAAGVL